MKYYLLYILFLCLYSIDGITQENYINYQEGINKAEKFIFDNKYEKALFVYDSIFNIFNYAFPKDLMIASQVAFLTRNDKKGYVFLEKSIVNGGTIEQVKKSRILDRELNTNNGMQFLTHYDSLKQVHTNKCNATLIQYIDSLLIIDQKLRNKDQSIFNNRILTLNKKLRNKWINNSKKSLIILDSIIAEHGFPSYNIVGNNNDRKFTFSLSSLFFYYHYPNAFSEFGEILLDEVKKGKLPAYDYALIKDYEIKHYNTSHKEQKEYYYYTFIRKKNLNDKDVDISLEQKNITNIRRKKIGLSSIETQRKKEEYSLKYFSEPEVDRVNFFYYDI